MNKESKIIASFDATELCLPNESREYELSLEIPEINADFPPDADVVTTLSQPLCPSFNGRNLQVVYSLKVFVKHATMTQIMEGQQLTLPIRIRQKPSLQSKFVSDPLTDVKALSNYTADNYY